jgi:hypothetical protein
VVLGLIGVCYWKSDTDFEIAKGVGALTMLIGAAPLYLQLRSNRRVFPLFALNTLYYAFGFAIGPFFTPSAEQYLADYDPANVLFGTGLVLVGVCSQIAGYAVAAHLVTPRVGRSQTILQMTDNQLVFCGWTLLLAGQATLLLPILSRLPSLGQFLRLASLAGFSIVLYCSLVRAIPVAQRLLFMIVFVPFIVWTGLISGSIAEGLRYLMLSAFVAAAVKRYVPAAIFAVIGVALYGLANPVKMEFRESTWRDDVSYGWTERGEIMIDLLNRYHVQGQQLGTLTVESPLMRDRNSTIDRLNQMSLLLRVTSYTPKIVPYWHGETFASLPAIVIPRALWPNKPARGLGQLFGHVYDVIGPFDLTTAINTPWLVEFYANFGIAGAALCMGLVGTLFRVIESRFLDLSIASHSAVMMIGLFGTLIFPESDVSLMWGGVILGLIALKLTSYAVAQIIPPGAARRSQSVGPATSKA